MRVHNNNLHIGILAGMWPCGVITLIRELFIAESKSQVYGHLHQFLQNTSLQPSKIRHLNALKHASNLLEYICYDDACHLKKYSINQCRCDLTLTTRYLSQTNIVVDKMHMAGHVDSWCKKECDPHLFSDLNKVGYVHNLN